MRCAEFQRFATEWVDGELDGDNRFGSEHDEFAAHAASCDACRQIAREHAGYREALRSVASADRAPDSLRAAIRRDLAAADRNLRPSARVVFGLAAAISAAFLMPGLFESPVTRADDVTDSVAPIVEASVEMHRRDLPVEVASASSQEVCDWFHDKVDFPVRLPTFQIDTPSQIVGARISHVRDHNAALVRYQVDDSDVSVLVFPDDGALDVPEPHSERVGNAFFLENRSGYNVAVFRDNGMAYAITTSMPRATFSHLVSSAALQR